MEVPNICHMATIGPALDFMLPHEGGFANNPADRGGPTKYGITQTTARAHGYTGDMRYMPVGVAISIYTQTYWPGLEGLRVQEVANKIFDMRVNFGVRGGDILAQEAVNYLGASVAEDGMIGPKTIAAINAVNAADMLEALSQVSEYRYKGIVQRDPSQGIFLKGWVDRARAVQKVVTETARETVEAVRKNPGGSLLVIMLAVGLGALMLKGKR